MSTTTPRLGLIRPLVGEQGWGPEIQATIDTLDAAVEATANKGAANGYAGLDANSRVAAYALLDKGGAEFNLNAADYGIAHDGSVDVAAAVQAVITAVQNAGGGRIRANGTYKFTSAGLTIDPSLCTIWGAPGTAFDFTGLSTGPAFAVGRLTAQSTRHSTWLADVKVLGPSSFSTTVDGIVYGDATHWANYIATRDVDITGFRNQEIYGSNAYIINHFGGSRGYCATAGSCHQLPGGSTNAGERITYVGMTFYNNQGVVNSAVNGEFEYFSCSFDYSNALFNINNSVVSLSNCHMENQVDWYSTSPITMTGTSGCMFTMHGGFILMVGGASPNVPSIVANTAGAGGGASFFGVRLTNLQTTTGYFATGSGYTVIRDAVDVASPTTVKLLSAAANLMADGSFENAAIVDNLFIYLDTAGITSRFTGTNINLVISGAAPHSGVQCLGLQKVGAVATAAAGAIAVPLLRGAKPGMQLWYKRSGSETGSFAVNTYWALLRTNASGVPVVMDATLIETDAGITLPATWTVFNLGASVRAPVWATHFIAAVDITAMSAGYLLVDDVVITEM